MKRIPLSQGHFALVDDDDYPIVSQYKWCYDNGYASRKITLAPGQYKKISLHRVLTNAQPGQMVDHADGNKLNNTRSNLRICNGSQNSANRRVFFPRFSRSASQFRGVRKELNSRNWGAVICLNNQRIYIGSYATEHEAAMAYDAKAVELFGEFAVLNFPFSSPVGDKGRLTVLETATS